MNDLQILNGDSLKVLPKLAAESVQSCLTSPPYRGLRDYDHPAQIGAETSPEIYVVSLDNCSRFRSSLLHQRREFI